MRNCFPEEKKSYSRSWFHTWIFVYCFWDITTLNLLDLELRFYMAIYLLNSYLLFLLSSNFIWITGDEDDYMLIVFCLGDTFSGYWTIKGDKWVLQTIISGQDKTSIRDWNECTCFNHWVGFGSFLFVFDVNFVYVVP